jgi:hypothetical protein
MGMGSLPCFATHGRPHRQDVMEEESDHQADPDISAKGALDPERDVACIPARQPGAMSAGNVEGNLGP